MNSSASAPPLSELVASVRRAAELARIADTIVITGVADLCCIPGASAVSFTASYHLSVDEKPRQRSARVNLADGCLTWRGSEDVQSRLARWSEVNAGGSVHGAYLRSCGDDPEVLVLADDGVSEHHEVALPKGRVESIQWSSDGMRLLLQVADEGADNGGADGGTQRRMSVTPKAPWAPQVDDGSFTGQWRRAIVIDRSSQIATGYPADFGNVWEVCWCGEAVAALASATPSEDAWYRAQVLLHESASNTQRTLYTSQRQVTGLCASRAGTWLALIEGLASDRGLVAGCLVVIEVASGAPRRLQTLRVDVTRVQWVDEQTLMWCGLRGNETVLGQSRVSDGSATELWASEDAGLGTQWLPEFAALAPGRACAVVSRFIERPVLSVIGGSQPLQPLLVIGSAAAEAAIANLGIRTQSNVWRSEADGKPIKGWLLQRSSEQPVPLALEVHGGPVWAAQPRWLGNNLLRWQLLEQGYAVQLANPRGSMGHGEDFAASVYGDPGGADAVDLESGVDHLVQSGIVNPLRLCVYGVSYGGYMAAWLPTRSDRFAAAMACSPVTNWVSLRYTGQAPSWCAVFLDELRPTPQGLHIARSPVHFAHQVNTPMLLVAGAMDRNTPPGQALEMYQALTALGKPAELVNYPLEGHGVRGAAATIDYAARTLAWFASTQGRITE